MATHGDDSGHALLAFLFADWIDLDSMRDHIGQLAVDLNVAKSRRVIAYRMFMAGNADAIEGYRAHIAQVNELAKSIGELKDDIVAYESACSFLVKRSTWR